MADRGDAVPADLAWWRACADPALLRAEVERLAGCLERAARVVAQHRDEAAAARERVHSARERYDRLLHVRAEWQQRAAEAERERDTARAALATLAAAARRHLDALTAYETERYLRGAEDVPDDVAMRAVAAERALRAALGDDERKDGG